MSRHSSARGRAGGVGMLPTHQCSAWWGPGSHQTAPPRWGTQASHSPPRSAASMGPAALSTQRGECRPRRRAARRAPNTPPPHPPTCGLRRSYVATITSSRNCMSSAKGSSSFTSLRARAGAAVVTLATHNWAWRSPPKQARAPQLARHQKLELLRAQRRQLAAQHVALLHCRGGGRGVRVKSCVVFGREEGGGGSPTNTLPEPHAPVPQLASASSRSLGMWRKKRRWSCCTFS